MPPARRPSLEQSQALPNHHQQADVQEEILPEKQRPVLRQEAVVKQEEMSVDEEPFCVKNKQQLCMEEHEAADSLAAAGELLHPQADFRHAAAGSYKAAGEQRRPLADGKLAAVASLTEAGELRCPLADCNMLLTEGLGRRGVILSRHLLFHYQAGVAVPKNVVRNPDLVLCILNGGSGFRNRKKFI